MDNSAKGLKYLNVINGSVQSKTFTFATFTLIVVAILIAGAIRPTITKISQINSEIKLKKIVNTQLGNKIDALASLTNQYATRNADLDSLSMIFPASGNYSLLMSNVEEIAKQNGFNLVGINFGNADKINLNTKVLKPWTVRINVKGNRANFVKFLSQLEQMPMYPKINKVAFTNKSDEEGQTPYSVELLIYKVDVNNFYE